MTKIYLQNKNVFPSRAKKKSFAKTLLFVLVIFSLLASTNGSVRNWTVKTIAFSIAPVFKTAEFISGIKENIVFLFKNKEILMEEINDLKERSIEVENELMLADYIKKENEELKTMLSRSDKKNYILGYIISRPPKSPYDTVIADVGSDSGVVQGMKAVAYSNVLIGYVAEVFPNASKIKLLSFPGEETNLIIESAKVSAIGFGLGGGNIEIKLPSSVIVNSGDKIMSDGSSHYLLGVADKIETDLTNPFQKIIFRMPINLNELQKIGVEK